MTHPPAEWYPDPELPGHVRYWDGTAWTEHQAPIPPHLLPPQPTLLPAVPVPTTPDGQPLAGWGWRALAQLLDGALVSIVMMVFTIPSQISMQRDLAELNGHLAPADGSAPDWEAWWSAYLEILREQMIWQLPVVVIGLAYYVGMLRWKGATVGKLVVGLQVRLRERQGRLPWGVVLSRVLVVQAPGILANICLIAGWWQVALLLSLLYLAFLLADYLWPLWDGKRQALHDKVARTNVVKVR